ncbi:MAG TPA: hypothetical protein VK357_08545 [Rubrobacteraceae bacterium]|nr:hypothetical protein [Rubrobacteraceae bacterium]
MISEESRTQGRKSRVVSVTWEGSQTMVRPETTIDHNFCSYNALAPGEAPLRLDSGRLVMFDRSRVVEYGVASAGARQTVGGQR